jgi:hypothetical protein
MAHNRIQVTQHQCIVAGNGTGHSRKYNKFSHRKWNEMASDVDHKSCMQKRGEKWRWVELVIARCLARRLVLSSLGRVNHRKI